MKFLRKLTVMLTTGALLAGVVAVPVRADTGGGSGTATAAAADDVKGTPFEKSVDRLNALGIMKGYPDGRFGTQDKITRAQFATMVVRALGLDTLGAAQQGQTKFADVDGGHWASGYINAAVGQGLVKGDPTGDFRPDANVSYAEAAAILVRALGYEPMVKGEWPSNYLNKAGELGLTKGVSFSAQEPATRGNIALMTDAALEVDIIDATSYDGEKVTYEKTPGRNLLTEKMGLTRLIGTVTMTPRVSDGVLANNEIKVSVDDVDEARDTKIYSADKEYTLLVKDTIDPNSLLAYDVTLLVDVGKKTDQEDDTVLHASIDNRSSDQVIDRVDYLDTDADHDPGSGDVVWTYAKVYLYNGKGYDFAKDPIIYYNNVKMDLAELNQAYHGGGPDVKMLLDKNGDVSFFEETEMYFNSAFVSSVRETDERILFEDLVPKGQNRNTDSITSGTLDLLDETYTLMNTNGKALKVSDVKEGDLIYLITAPSENRPDASPDFYHIVVSPSNTVEGTITEIYGADDIQDYKVTIGDTEYKMSRDATYSDDGNDTYKPLWKDPGLLEDFVNEKVTVYLGWDGRIRHVMKGSSDDDLVGVVSDEPWVVTSSSGRDVYVEITKGDGIASTYKMTDDTVISTDYGVTNQNNDDILTWYTTNGGTTPTDFGLGTVVNYTLKADGSLDELYENSIDGADYAVVSATVNNASAIDEDDDRINVNGKWYLVTSETAIIDASDTADISATSWKSIEDHVWATGESWTVTLVINEEDDPQLDGLVINSMTGGSSSLSSSIDVAMITRKSITSDGWKFTFDIEGQSYSYLLDSVSVVDAVYSDDNIGGLSDATKHDVKNLEPADLVQFTLNSDGEIDFIQEHAAFYGTISSVNASSNLLKIDHYTYNLSIYKFESTGSTKSFVVNADTQYYDISGGSITRTSFDKLAKGQDVMVVDFDGDGIADAVKVINFSDYE